MFCIFLKFLTRQTDMIWIWKIRIWWYGKYSLLVCILLLCTACIFKYETKCWARTNCHWLSLSFIYS